MSPMFKVTNYEIATGEAHVARLIDEGYEPYGDPTWILDADASTVLFRQAMVLKSPFDIDEYVNIMKTLMILVNNLGNLDLESEFTEEELSAINERFG